ncbi:MAG TPA: cytochrome c oxidase subunit I [Chthoniobacteraceae bacterium]|jgi:cytochrome c oxidase subunit 1/cytochrome c oxidase subunit I+III|nr:cytochrome c oxidase subunit I [Chthoniobacteraceae bacterium]
MNGEAVLETVLTPDQRAHYRLAWLSTVDHKRIGILYMLTGLVFFIIGGIEALIMRLQLAVPNNHLVAPDTFNMLFTMHGTTMIFLVVMPLVFGFANYFVPMQIGARDMAFPRLNALSFWLVPMGGIILYFGMLVGDAPMVGWFAYAPLSETPYASQLGVDYWAVSLLVMGIGSVGTAINLICTVLSLRAPGMTLRRLPLFTWMNFVNSFLVLFAIPVLNAALVMILIDRRLNTHFFLPAEGGSPILWQHIFWAFGHPEVYIMVLPAFGIISEIVPVFSRKPIFGYEFVAGSTVAIMFLSLGVWAHHMFTVGMGRPMDLFFSFASMLIAIPTGVKVLNWSATMFGGRIRLKTPMLFAVAFLIHFLCGGITGISHAIVPLDWQTKNSYFLVAHFHFIAVGGIVFAVLGGLHYWFPKMSGRMLSEKLGKISFWLMLVGFNGTFIIQHFLGFAGMGRRIYTYPDLPGWGWMNMVSTVSAFFMAAAALVVVWNIISSLLYGEVAGDNPWEAWTLEWAGESPPPVENFDYLPPIRSRRPLWDDVNPDRPDPVVGGATEAISRPDKNHCAMIAFVLSETGFFGTLLLTFLFYNVRPPAGLNAKDLDLIKTGFFSLCLFSSSFTIWRSEVALHKRKVGGCIGWLAATLILGIVFIGGQGLEYAGLFAHGARIDTNLFTTTFFTLTGFHGIHVIVGLLVMIIVLGLMLAGDFSADRPPPALAMLGIYWHFVDIVWVLVLTVAYILPRFL